MTQSYDLAEGLPPPKRLKTQFIPDYDAFQPGSIIKCKLINFMSYELTEFHFGPRMNLIIGPNGTGKSTFVCAVCIGLNGKLSNLGKESMTTDGFIKDNKNFAEINLELKSFNNELNKSITITTKLFRNKKTQWEINFKSVSENEIKKFLKSYNIQLDNLCQFLPQDRVSKFADLKSEDLLKEIERSYKNGELLDDHYNIIKIQNLINQDEKILEESTNNLLDLKNKNNLLKDKVDKHRHFIKLKKELEKTNMIRPYVKLQDKKSQMINLKENFEIERDNFNQFELKVKPIEDTLKNSDNILIETESLLKDCGSIDFKIKKEIDNINLLINKLDEKNKKSLSQIKDFDEKLNIAKDEYLNLKKNIIQIEENLSNFQLPNDEEINLLKEKRQLLKEEFLESSDIITDIKSKYNAGIKKLESIKSNIMNQQNRLNSKDRINTLDQNKYKVAISAIQSLRRFKDSNLNLNLNYFEPALITLNVNNKFAIPAVEALIPYSHLNAIVVTNKNDFNNISKFLYDERKIMASIRTIGSKDFNIDNDRIPRETIKRLGFDGFITDFLSGPKEIIQMLCENVFLHRIPISFKSLNFNQKDLINKEIQNGLSLVKYISNDEIYTMNKSSYGKRQITTNIKSFRMTSNIFQGGLSEQQKILINENIENLNKEFKEIDINNKEFKKLIQEKQNELKLKQNEFNQYEEDIKNFGIKKREIVKWKQKLNMTEERLAAKKKAIKSLKSNNNDSNKEKIFEQINKRLNEKINLQKINKRELLIKKMKNDIKIINLKVKKIEEENKSESIKSLHKSIEIEKEEKIKNLESIKNDYRLSKKEYQEFLSKYKLKVSEYSIEDKDDMKKIIEEMANKDMLNEEGLNSRIDKLKSEMELNNRSGGEISIKQLEENQIKINELELKVPNILKIINNNKEELNNITIKWEDELNKIVEIISNDFGDNMNKIASGGCIKLDKSEEDFNKWKLIIKVSFRDNEELSNFNGAQHSGGEKSTTTAVFLNSLQGLTNTPFRIVDEINQGMDANNERKAHELIVKRATSASVQASQYFLITPKLLSGLHYGPSMAVHCIFAGRWCEGCADDLPYLEMGVAAKYT